MTQPLPVPPPPTWAVPYPEYVANGPMLRLQDAVQKVACAIASVRKERGLTSLRCPQTMPTAPIMLGQEWLAREQSPPRIVMVPTKIALSPAIKVGWEPMKGQVSQANPRPFGEATFTSMFISGATRTRPGKTRFGTSARRRSSIGSSSSPGHKTSATSRTSTSAKACGGSRQTTSGSAASSLFLSLGRPTSAKSLGSFFPMPRARRMEFRSTRPSKCLSLMGQRAWPASLSRLLREVSR